MWWKISAVVAASIATYYIISLDNIDNVWQYAVCLVCLIYLLFCLVVRWNEVITRVQVDEITDVDE